jgi:hypothetical protein
MGLFASLFSVKVPEQSSVKREVVFLMGAAKFGLEITEEEHYQTALEAICGQRIPTGVNRFETAYLILEDKNPRNKNAVRVELRGKQVGYLSPEAAIPYRRQLIAKGMPRANVQCQAVIRGGWVSSDGRKGPYEVWLDIPTLYQ